MALLELKGFKSNEFKNLHPGGNIGKDLKKISEIMHIGKSMPLADENEKMSKTLLTMTKKSFGCVGVLNKKSILVGLITDGDLRRSMDANLINKKASDLMTINPSIGHENMLVSEALNIMKC